MIEASGKAVEEFENYLDNEIPLKIKVIDPYKQWNKKLVGNIFASSDVDSWGSPNKY